MGCLLALAMLLGACGGRESVRPADSKPAASASEAPNRAEIRAAMAEGLIGDRENARHTAGPIPRQSEQLDPPPAPKQIHTQSPVQPPPALASSPSPRVAAAPSQAADKAIVDEAGLPKAAGTPPPAKVAKPDPVKTPPTPLAARFQRAAARPRRETCQRTKLSRAARRVSEQGQGPPRKKEPDRRAQRSCRRTSVRDRRFRKRRIHPRGSFAAVRHAAHGHCRLRRHKGTRQGLLRRAYPVGLPNLPLCGRGHARRETHDRPACQRTPNPCSFAAEDRLARDRAGPERNGKPAVP